MLDPFTALSLAGNVVQFVQLACNLTAKAHDVYSSTSGISEENLEMETVTTRLLGTVQELDTHLNTVDQATSHASRSESSKRLFEIANACRRIAEDILRRLDAMKMREPPTVWRSVRQAFKIMWTKEELDALMKRLKAYIAELDTTILVSMKRSIDLVYFRATQGFYKLDQAAQQIVDLLILNRSVFTSALQLHTKEIKGVIISEQAQTRAMILDLVQQKGLVQATSASFVQSVGHQEPQANIVDEKEAKMRSWFLDSLGFSAMQDRQDEVAQAYRTTFEWMFDEPKQQKGSLPWTNFVDWLRHGEGLYWVNGKAGSGKSTLMKYIYGHRKTAETLSQWSGSMPILVSTFFFWNSGTPEQRSQVGLLRSLLFQVLQHRPVLIPLLFPEEYASLQSYTITRAEEYPRRSWSLTRLQDALHRLVDLDDLPLKLCFFIDGLDEFEGNEDNNDRQHMIHLLRRLASSRFIKVCLSSRPLLIFEESFQNDPGLRLQDLTSGDIKRYVVDKLSMDPGMRLIADHEPLRKHDFVKEICNKAQGVFLWVKLVVRSLVDGLSNSDRMTHLRARLDELPNDLEDLYSHMIGNIDKLYLMKTSQIFQMVQTARYIQGQRSISTQRTTPVTVLLLALALEDRPEVDLDTASEAWLTKNLSNLCDIMRRRLQTWCAGLLEVPDFIWNRVNALDADATVRTKITWEVAFLHRTARDFIESEPVWKPLKAFTANTNFDPRRLVNNPLGYGLFQHEILEPATHAMLLAQRASITDENAHIALLDELDLAISRHLLRWTGNYIGHWSQYLDVAITANSVLSMLDLAVLYGLHRYVRARLLRLYARDPEHPAFLHVYLREDPSNTARPRRNITLLDMAVRSDCPSPETAQVLLEFGADPNEKSGYQALSI